MNQHNFTYPFTDGQNGVRFIGKTYLFRHNWQDINIPDHLMEFLITCANKGMAVECIKFIRSNFNLPVKEAKDIFDTIRRHTSSTENNAPF